MISVVIVVLDEAFDLSFEIAGQVVIFEQDPVLQRLMPALDFALGLRVIGCAADMGDVALLQPGGEIAGNIARAPVLSLGRRAALVDGSLSPDRSLRP